MTKVIISPDVFAESPLEYTSVEITYRTDARTVLGNRPVDTLEELQKLVSSGDYVALPVHAYVHGSIALSTSSWYGRLSQGHAEFDSGLSGYMLYSKADIRTDYQVKRITKKVLEQVRAYMSSLLAEWSAYLNGDCWYIQLVDNDGEVFDMTSIIGSYQDELDNLIARFDLTDDDITIED